MKTTTNSLEGVLRSKVSTFFFINLDPFSRVTINPFLQDFIRKRGEKHEILETRLPISA